MTLMKHLLGWAMLALFLSARLNGAAATPDFVLTLEPAIVALVPGKAAGFIVSVVPLNGFDQPVLLRMRDLPAGVTATFDPNAVTPPGTAILTLNASTDAIVGEFPLNLEGVGGGLTNGTAASVNVNFGLVPLCYGEVHGTVTDSETGLPIKNAVVNGPYGTAGVTTDSEGRYVLTNVRLGQDNLPLQVLIVASATEYLGGSHPNIAVACGVVSRADISLVPRRYFYANLIGKVSDPESKPVGSVRVEIAGSDNRTVYTLEDGTFSARLTVPFDNAPGTYYLGIRKSGYWERSLTVTAAVGEEKSVEVTLVPICHGISIRGRVLYDETGLPAAGANVILRTPGVFTSVLANAEGNYLFSDSSLTLNQDNSPAGYRLESYAAGYYGTNTAITVAECDKEYEAPVMRLSPQPKDQYATLQGHVYDEETGAPVVGAKIDGYQETDATGFYFWTNIYIGKELTSTRSPYATHPDYHPARGNFVLYADQVTTGDFRMVRKRFGYLAGTVRDMITAEPLSGVVLVGGFGTRTTDIAGRFESGPMELHPGNEPVRVEFLFYRSGYWGKGQSAIVSADQTNVVDLTLLKVCTGNVFGTIVNALTQEPIAGATIRAMSEYGEKSAATDSSGRFALRELSAGQGNAPLRVGLYASAPGFNSQSKEITVFCGANIVVDFGRTQTAFGAVEGYVTNSLTGVPLTNVFVGSSFGGATTTDGNGYYTLSSVPLGLNGADSTVEISVRPEGLPPQTRPVGVSANVVSRLDFDFGTTTTTTTDLAVAMEVTPPSPKQGEDFTVVVRLRNHAGDAENVALKSVLPAGVTFKQASVSDNEFSAPVFSNGVVTTSKANLAAGSSVTLELVVSAAAAGTFTLEGSMTTSTPDTNSVNDSATLNLTVSGGDGGGGETPPGLTAGAITFNPQTGLFEQRVSVTLSNAASTGVQLEVRDVPADRVRNASGTDNGVAFVQRAGPVAAGGTVQFLIEYYLPDRNLPALNPQFAVAAFASLAPPTATGRVFSLDREALLVDGRFLIEFVSTPGRTYVVQYSSDTVTWESAVPPVVAAGTRVQWFDDGPPKTRTKPNEVGSRFYRVIEQP